MDNYNRTVEGYECQHNKKALRLPHPIQKHRRAGEHPSVLTPREGLGVGEAKAIVTGKSLILRNPKRDLFIFKHPRGYFTATCVAHNGRGEQYHDQMTFRPYDGSAKEGRSSIYYTGLFKHSSFRVGNAGNVEAAIDSAYQRHFG